MCKNILTQDNLTCHFQSYLDVLTKNIILSSSLPVKIFLDPQNYSTLLKGMLKINVI